MFCEIPTFGRCCFCLPLRQGVLTIGYFNIITSILLVATYSLAVHNDYSLGLMAPGNYLDDEVCIAIYLLEMVFNIVLVYGAHMKHLMCLKIFYYFALTTCAASFLIQMIGLISSGGREMDFIPLLIVGICFQIYLILLVGSLLKKIEVSGATFENQLHQFINQEPRAEGNDVYPSTVVPNNVIVVS